MDGKDGYKQKGGHRQTDERHECPENDGEAAQDLDQNREPRHQTRCRYADCVQDCGERFRPLAELGKTVLHETKTNNEPEQDGGPTS